jgi:hypothetical protein
MSVAPIAAWPFDKPSLERRARQRFPLMLAMEYRLLGKQGSYGLGRTRNISSSGVLFEAAEQQAFSGSIELVVSWPCLLDGVCALKLVMKGRVVRSESSGVVAIESNQHEFRTSGTRAARRINF